jgi:hypothetical protein
LLLVVAVWRAGRRINNPTVRELEKTVALLEGGCARSHTEFDRFLTIIPPLFDQRLTSVWPAFDRHRTRYDAIATSSGMGAVNVVFMALLGAGKHIICHKTVRARSAGSPGWVST